MPRGACSCSRRLRRSRGLRGRPGNATVLRPQSSARLSASFHPSRAPHGTLPHPACCPSGPPHPPGARRCPAACLPLAAWGPSPPLGGSLPLHAPRAPGSVPSAVLRLLLAPSLHRHSPGGPGAPSCTQPHCS